MQNSHLHLELIHPMEYSNPIDLKMINKKRKVFNNPTSCPINWINNFPNSSIIDNILPLFINTDTGIQ